MGLAGNILSNGVGYSPDLVAVHLVNPADFLIGLTDCIDDFGNIKAHFLTIALDDMGPYIDGFCLLYLFHTTSPCVSNIRGIPLLYTKYCQLMF